MSPYNNKSKIDDPLYNSRLLKNYVEYVKKFHPQVDVNSILDYAEITKYELEDQGHWLSQRQVDRFHEVLTKKTSDPNISREVGRFAANSKASGAVKQYALGFMTPSSAYWMLEKIASTLSRAFTLKTRQINRDKVEVTVIPKPGVREKPYQCENRIGHFEAISKLFTKKYAEVDHTTCIHRGGDVCKYIITWEKTSYLVWRRRRNYLIFFGLLIGMPLHFLMPLISWVVLIFSFIVLIMGVSSYSDYLEKVELLKNLESQQGAAGLLLEQINIRYNDALLFKEIGQATSEFLDIQKLLKSIISAMERWLDFDRGGIWIINREKTRLVYNIGYGYDSEIELLLRGKDFHLDRPGSRGVAIQAFKQQKPYLVNDISEIEKDLSEGSMEFIKRIGARSFICVPIVYEGESLGVVSVDNLRSKRPLSQSDMSFLRGIATQISVGIHNAMSYQRLQESREREKNLRKLFEKYVPAPVIKQYVNSGEMDLFRGEESSIAALFLDIRGFTSSTEAMDARDVVSFLNDYFDKCSLVISEENGHINKYTGDGFLAIFGAPETLERQTTYAFNAACKILGFSKRFILVDKPVVVGIGINSGRAILGNIGSHTKIEYTAVGDTINTAARLQEFTKIFNEYSVIMSRSVWKELSRHPYHHAIENLGEQKIRGKKEKLEAFGFRLLQDQSVLLDQDNKGFIPLQRIKGV